MRVFAVFWAFERAKEIADIKRNHFMIIVMKGVHSNKNEQSPMLIVSCKYRQAVCVIYLSPHIPFPLHVSGEGKSYPPNETQKRCAKRESYWNV